METTNIIFLVGIAWSMLWTGLGTWRAARLGEPIWFSFLLILNMMGILPIIYLIIKRNEE